MTYFAPFGSAGLKAPCSSIVDTWALQALLCPDFGVYVCIMMVPGDFGYHVLLQCL